MLSLFLLASCSSGRKQESPTSNIPQNNQTPASQETLNNELGLYRQAITELNNNELDKAEQSFTKMTELHPDLAGPWANLALVYLKQEHMEKAEENIQIALQKNPDMPQALNLAGYIENQKGEINQAKSFYEKAIKNKPDYALAHYNLALLYDIYLQDIPKAVQHYEQYLSLIKVEDSKTKSWVEELRLNMKSDNT